MQKATIILLFILIVIPFIVYADGFVHCGGPSNPCTINDLFAVINDAKNFLLKDLTPAFAVMMIIVGGISFLLAGASPDVVNNAKKVLFAATAGLVISIIGGG